MSGPGGTKTVHCAAALVVGSLLAVGLGACAYEDIGDPQPAAAQTRKPAPTMPAKDPGVLGVEARNYAELHQRLAGAPGSVLLADAGPADGPGVGFRKAATLKTAGPHTVTLTCVGGSQAQIFLSQDTGSGTEHMAFKVDCTETQTRVVQLQKGYISAQLTRSDPAGDWTGAVAGIKITAK